jgi:hypothetical protein
LRRYKARERWRVDEESRETSAEYSKLASFRRPSTLH